MKFKYLVTAVLAASLIGSPALAAVQITSPAANSTVSGTITITSHCTNAQISVDSTVIGSTNTPDFSTTYDTTKVADGSHTITAACPDVSGTDTASVTVTVQNNVATIGTPVLVTENSGNTNTLTTTSAIPAGQLIVVTATPAASTGSVTGISENSGGGNTWLQADTSTDTSATHLFYCSNCGAIPSGTVFTAAGTDPAPQVMSIEYVSGANGGLDQHKNFFVPAAGSGISQTLPTLTATPEIVFGATQTFGGAVNGYTEGSGFHTLTNPTTIVGTAYGIFNATTGPTWAPTWSGSHGYNGVLVSFKASQHAQNGNYVGPGDIKARTVWYGSRAYSSASRGQKLFNVCDNTGVSHAVSLGTGDGSTTTFTTTASSLPIYPGSVAVTYKLSGTTYTGYDGKALPGDFLFTASNNSNSPYFSTNGTNYVPTISAMSVDYSSTGAISITFTRAPDSGTAVTMNYLSAADQACQDMFSDSTTGDLVPVTFSTGVVCPNHTLVGNSIQLGTCTAKTAYDLTQNGADVTQANPILRPVLMAKAVPVIGVNRACLWYPDWGVSVHAMLSASRVNWGALPMTFSGVINQQSSGLRPPYPNSSSQWLRPSTGHPRVFFVGPGDGDQFHNYQAQPGNGILMSAGTNSASVFAADHMPHTIQAMFSASGTASSLFVDGVATTGLSTGTTAPSSADTVELGTNLVGVLCEAGFASGDQSASNSAIDANQTAYYFTPNTQVTTVYDWTVDFDSGTGANHSAGQVVTWNVWKDLFNDPSNHGWSDGNYVYTSDNKTPCVTTDGATDGNGAACQQAPVALAHIAPDGKTGKGLEVIADGSNAAGQGNCGYPVNGAGIPSWFAGPHGVAALNTNALRAEWDEMLRDHTTAANGLDFDLHSEGKNGMLNLYYPDPRGYPSGYGQQNMWFGGTSTTQYSLGALLSDQQAPNVPDPSAGTGGDVVAGTSFYGPVNIGQWYHYRMETVLGPMGFIKEWITPPNGQPFVVAAQSRTLYNGGWVQDPTGWENRLGIGIQPHFGGQPNGGLGSGDCMQHTSYLVYDNIHITGFLQ